ncbi:MAG: permease [bacterium]|nr:permease [bacterium]
MNWKSEWKPLAIIVVVFLAAFHLPTGVPRFDNAVGESLQLVRWYAREHVILCLIPAFFIAGAIGVFVRQESVMRYLGAKANKVLAYGVASVSGTVLAVCSCTVLPLFAGIYRMGAGLGPASAFLYSGPAINVLAIVLTARVLGIELGTARAIGAVVFSILVGLAMHFIFRKEETARMEEQMNAPVPEATRPLWRTVIYFALMIAILVFANWGKPGTDRGFWYGVYAAKWWITGISALLFAVVLVKWFGAASWKITLAALPTACLAVIFPEAPVLSFGAGAIALSVITSTASGELKDWFDSTWGFAKQILPLLLLGVLASGFLLGRPGHDGVIPSHWISDSVGGNSLWSNFFASLAGAFMYFATLTEVPILQGLLGSGMGQGPALALLLAGPALSLPSMLVLSSIMGFKKTFVFVMLVIIMATITGLIYGSLA